MSAFDELAKRLRKAETGVNRKYSDRIRLIEGWRPWIVALGVLAAAVAAFSRLDTGTAGIVMAIAGGIVAALCGLLVAIYDYRKLELGTELRESEALAEESIAAGREAEARLTARNEALAADINAEREMAGALAAHRRSMLRVLTAMQETGERWPLTEPVLRVIEAMLDAAMSDLTDAFGFEQREHWTISIFTRIKAGRSTVMERQIARWWDRNAEKLPPRRWKEGEGFTGFAWRNRVAVIEPDVTIPDVGHLYMLPAGKALMTDTEKYVSVVSVPILVGAEDDVWGAITITSNKAGRFQRNPTDIGSQNVDIVRQMEAIIATQVALRTARGFISG